jgi:hypothetical protein
MKPSGGWLLFDFTAGTAVIVPFRTGWKDPFSAWEILQIPVSSGAQLLDLPHLGHI